MKRMKVSAIAAAAWKSPFLQKIRSIVTNVGPVIFQELKQLTPIQKGLFVGVFFLGARFGRIHWKRFTQAVDVPSVHFGPKAPWLRGRVVSVSDGDTFRFYHIPTPFHSTTLTLKKGQKMSKLAMPIRICTMDAPETPRFGKPGQPFALEAKEELKKLIDGKIIQIRLLQKDQYGRAVAQVLVPRRRGNKYVDELLLRAGLAEVYQGMGAVYGPLGKDAYLELEAQARKQKLGIWSQTKRESAAQYKKRNKRIE